jgi:Ni,Fe-hydrogenase I cytochrome b subunit
MTKNFFSGIFCTQHKQKSNWHSSDVHCRLIFWVLTEVQCGYLFIVKTPCKPNAANPFTQMNAIEILLIIIVIFLSLENVSHDQFIQSKKISPQR